MAPAPPAPQPPLLHQQELNPGVGVPQEEAGGPKSCQRYPGKQNAPTEALSCTWDRGVPGMPKRKCKKRGLKPLTDTQKLCVQLVFDGVKSSEIASRVGVHRGTIWRWKQRPDFQKEISRLQAQWRSEMRRLVRSRYVNPESKAAKAKLKKSMTRPSAWPILAADPLMNISN